MQTEELKKIVLDIQKLKTEKFDFFGFFYYNCKVIIP